MEVCGVWGSAVSQVVEGVLGVLARLLEVAFGLTGLAFSGEVPVAGGLADGLLGLAGQLLSLVGDLVVRAHHNLLVDVVPNILPGYRPITPILMAQPCVLQLIRNTLRWLPKVVTTAGN